MRRKSGSPVLVRLRATLGAPNQQASARTHEPSSALNSKSCKWVDRALPLARAVLRASDILSHAWGNDTAKPIGLLGGAAAGTLKLPAHQTGQRNWLDVQFAGHQAPELSGNFGRYHLSCRHGQRRLATQQCSRTRRLFASAPSRQTGLW